MWAKDDREWGAEGALWSCDGGNKRILQKITQLVTLLFVLLTRHWLDKIKEKRISWAWEKEMNIQGFGGEY